MKITSFLPVFFLLFVGLSKAQSLVILDCSPVLLISNNNQLALEDSTMSLTTDSLLNDIDEFGIMLIVQSSDSASVNKVHIDLGNSVGDSTLLSTSFDHSSNTDIYNLTYETYEDYINVKLGEYTIDSLIHFTVKLEDHLGNFSSPFNGTIEK